jgi:hypothetical protein
VKRASPYLWASRRAEALVRAWGLDALPIDVHAIAAKEGIEVRPMPSSIRGVSGMLQRVEEVYGIAYATFADNPGFERFSIAHELGHYFLDGHPEALLAATGLHQSRAGFASGDKRELEADHFAASLLMPGPLFERAIAKAGSGFGAIERVAETCLTSLTATAIRYAECADEPAAVVVSAGAVVDYWFESDAFKRIRGGGWLHRGEPLPPRTPTAAFNRDPGCVERCERREASSSVREWFGDGPDLELAEDVVGLGSYGKTLTVLFADVPPPDESEEEDEKLGAWEPTFHRSRRR